MSKKTLPDELRSVLLAHSLDAPDPDSTVEQILAATVGIAEPTGGTDHTVAGAGHPVAGTGRTGAGPGRTGAWIRPRRPGRWWPSGQLLGAAVVVALLVLAATGLYSLRGRSHQQQATSNGAALPATGSLGQAPHTLGQAPNTVGSGPNKIQQPGAVPADPAVPTDLPCSSIPGGHGVIGARTSFRLTSTGETLYVYEFLCIGDNGARSASEVEVFQRLGGTLSYLSTLVPIAKDGHVDYLSALPNGVRIQGTDQSNGPRPGDVVSVSYTTRDGGKSFASSGRIIAKACQRADLTARVVSADGGVTGQHQVLQLTNLTAYPCGLEGFPNLVALVNGKPAGPMLTPTLSGPAGGLTKAKVPPIVVLIPGGTAGAIIELASEHPTCAPANQLAVTLPNGTSLGPVPAQLSTCGLDVHPLVDNPYGTD